jgi:hypothetical protein
VRPFAVADGNAPALAVAEPVRAGQTICFTLRDAIGARDDMKAMLDEQAEARGSDTPKFGFYFNCAGRGSALYGSRLTRAIRRRFGALSLAGIEKLIRDRPNGRASANSHVHRRTALAGLTGIPPFSPFQAVAELVKPLPQCEWPERWVRVSYLSSHQKTVIARQWNASSDDCVTIVSTIWQFWCSLIQDVTFSPKFSRSCAIVAERPSRR